ncbi:phospholipase A [Ramlibacter pallidus]|uniref:Phospholipase A1 n=1 Tax=Ramlibacter pallidus TaxID=2780087 RepID=A0ABR9S0I2_9BURK|nr:phospholipase A [Ramlibacter pallidus]MBE7367026.1 phospholipase A [Ramlibacter pallidus]
MLPRPALAALLLAFASLTAAAQDAAGWQACAALTEPEKRLSCFDRWAEGQRAPATTPAAVTAAEPSDAPVRSAPGARLGMRLTAKEGCRDPRYSELSRFWELVPGADCGNFGIRGFRPISLDVVTADVVNRLPTSGNPTNNATVAQDYRHTELRLQLSVRTKIAQGLLVSDSERSDSLWLAYSQQSYWQLFTPQLSRPFRSTDHEPEIIYVAPLQSPDPERWRLRFGGAGLVHQSNGQALPLSRSWNRFYLMAGAERGPLQLHARLWTRIGEGGTDDNPGISNFIGRGELRAVWHADRRNLWSATVRHALKSDGKGSVRLEWFRSLGDDGVGPPGGLQLHTQLFHGYGDSLIDYNRRRTVLSVGLALVEW